MQPLAGDTYRVHPQKVYTYSNGITRISGWVYSMIVLVTWFMFSQVLTEMKHALLKLINFLSYSLVSENNTEVVHLVSQGRIYTDITGLQLIQ